jgi:hypothetical protein
MVDVVFVSMCDGVVGVICNVEEGGCLLKKVGGGLVNKPMWWGGLCESSPMYIEGMWGLFMYIKRIF